MGREECEEAWWRGGCGKGGCEKGGMSEGGGNKVQNNSVVICSICAALLQPTNGSFALDGGEDSSKHLAVLDITFCNLW